MLNIQRALDHGYRVFIYYVYQDPQVAWNFTKIREQNEGRLVPMETFISAYYAARKNVIQAKEKYGTDVIIDVILKDFNNNIAEYINDVQNVELIAPQLHSKQSLEENLK